jgi:hypothetical protein
MCNFYSITTNQEAIRALVASSTAMSAISHRCRACFRSGSGGPQLGRRARNDDDALGHAAATTSRWIPGN